METYSKSFETVEQRRKKTEIFIRHFETIGKQRKTTKSPSRVLCEYIKKLDGVREWCRDNKTGSIKKLALLTRLDESEMESLVSCVGYEIVYIDSTRQCIVLENSITASDLATCRRRWHFANQFMVWDGQGGKMCWFGHFHLGNLCVRLVWGKLGGIYWSSCFVVDVTRDLNKKELSDWYSHLLPLMEIGQCARQTCLVLYNKFLVDVSNRQPCSVDLHLDLVNLQNWFYCAMTENDDYLDPFTSDMYTELYMVYCQNLPCTDIDALRLKINMRLSNKYLSSCVEKYMVKMRDLQEKNGMI
jgi:hypothetical protein